MMFSRSRSKETEFFNFETELKYFDEDPRHFVVDADMIKQRVRDVKMHILTMSMMSHVKEKPENLQLYLVLPGNDQTQDYTLLPLDDSKMLKEYMKDLSRTIMLKLQSPMGIQPKQ